MPDMLKARLRAAERRAGARRPGRRKLRVAVYYDDDAPPASGPDEDLILLHCVHTRPEVPAEPVPVGRDRVNGEGDPVVARAALAREIERLEREAAKLEDV